MEESRYYLILARDLGYGQSADLMPLFEEVSSPGLFWLRAPEFWLLAPSFWLRLCCSAGRALGLRRGSQPRPVSSGAA